MIDDLLLVNIAERIVKEVFHNMVPLEPAKEKIIRIILEEHRFKQMKQTA